MNHLNIYAKVRSGKCVVHKTTDNFSEMASDRCHEQDNGAVKASNEAVGLSENPAA